MPLLESEISKIIKRLNAIVISVPDKRVSIALNILFSKSIDRGITIKIKAIVLKRLAERTVTSNSFLKLPINAEDLTFCFDFNKDDFVNSNGELVILKKSGRISKYVKPKLKTITPKIANNAKLCSRTKNLFVMPERLPTIATAK